MKPITGDSPVRDVFPEAVEVVTWIDFGTAEDLTAAARVLEAAFGRDPDAMPAAEPGRHLYALVWPCDPEDFTGAPEPGWFIESGEGAGEPLAALWTNAYLLGVLRAAWILATVGEAAIGGRVYAIRVQAEGAHFPGTVQHGDGGPVL